MIAEMKGKLWQTDHNLNDRSEDNLTGIFSEYCGTSVLFSISENIIS